VSSLSSLPVGGGESAWPESCACHVITLECLELKHMVFQFLPSLHICVHVTNVVLYLSVPIRRDCAWETPFPFPRLLWILRFRHQDSSYRRSASMTMPSHPRDGWRLSCLCPPTSHRRWAAVHSSRWQPGSKQGLSHKEQELFLFPVFASIGLITL